MKNSMQDSMPYFDSNRMAAEYYEKMYTYIMHPTIRNDAQ
jgi:hypothetical protein